MAYEIAIVGAGPAGMQAAISAATDGISCVVLEKSHIGGAIRHTPRLENVAFVAPGGWTGQQFADNMQATAEYFGVKFNFGAVRALEREGEVYRLHYAIHDTFESLTARFVILALGGKWKPVSVPGVHSGHAEDRVQYGPAGAAGEWNGKDVVVVGGGPAAGQCIVEVAKTARSVRVLLRSGWTCPRYLIDRVHYCDNVIVHKDVTIESFDEDGTSYVRYALPSSSSKFHAPADKVFLCGGVEPDTGWLRHSLFPMNDSGRLQTLRPSLMTDIENVFAIGDCRDGSTARVCAALGDGSACITEIWAIKNKAPMLPHKERK